MTMISFSLECFLRVELSTSYATSHLPAYHPRLLRLPRFSELPSPVSPPPHLVCTLLLSSSGFSE